MFLEFDWCFQYLEFLMYPWEEHPHPEIFAQHFSISNKETEVQYRSSGASGGVEKVEAA